MDQDLKNKIIGDFGLTQMTEASQEDMIDKIGTLLFESVVERSLDTMDEGMIGEFERIVTESGEDYGKVISFLRERVPGFTEIVAEELARLRRATSGIFS